MYCSNCQTPLREGDQFCASCGQPVAQWQANAAERPKGNSRWLLVLAIAAFLLLCCGAAAVGGYFFFQNQNQVTPLIEENLEMLQLEATVLAQATQVAEQIQNMEEPSQQSQETTPQAEQLSPDAADVVDGGLQIWFDEALMQGVSVVTVDPTSHGGYVPWDYAPMHLSLEVQNPKGGIHLVPVGAYVPMGDFGKDMLQELQHTLDNRPGVASWGCVPTWDFPCAHQQMNINVSYFDFQNGSGIRSVTVYAPQDTSGINNQSLDYYYNGLTANGQFYVYANFDLRHTSLSEDDYNVPNEVMLDMTGDKLREFVISYGDTLESLPDGYQPQLEILDAVVTSLRVEIQ